MRALLVCMDIGVWRYLQNDNQGWVDSSKIAFHKTSFWDYESEKMNDVDNWSDPYGDEQAYYGGWSREDVESGLADAYE